MTATIVKMRRAAIKLECSTCGASGEASCDCGTPYVAAGTRAEKAVAANPGKSDRAIAADIGVSHQTVIRARKKTTGPSGPVAPRKGKDGKVRALPRRPEPKIFDHVNEINAFHRELVGFLNDFTERFTSWYDDDPPIDKDGKATLMQALYLCADGFAKLVQTLDDR